MFYTESIYISLVLEFRLQKEAFTLMSLIEKSLHDHWNTGDHSCLPLFQKGNEVIGTSDLGMADTLCHYMTGGHKRPLVYII